MSKTPKTKRILPSRKRLPKVPCQNCRMVFQPQRAWQIFCTPGCRRSAHFDDRIIEHACAYCGMIANTVDHVPPTSVRPTIIELRLVHRYPFTEVQCCSECNSLLGRRPLWTVVQRREFIHARLRRRYKKYLALPDWSEMELLALESTLRGSIEHGLAVKSVVLNRLAWRPTVLRDENEA